MKKQKKVLFVATVASHIRRFHTPYLKLFKEKDYKTYVASGWNLSDDEKIDYCDNYTEISVQRSPYSFKNLKAIRELKDLISAEKFDMIHCHTPMGAVVARLAAKKARKKYGTRVIYTAHGFHFYSGAPKKNWILFYPVEWYLAKYTDTIITINREDYKRAREKFGRRCKDIQYIPGVGVDPKRFNLKMTEKDKHELRASLGLKDKDFVVIFPAELNHNKNQIMLINAMQIITKDHKDTKLLLPGKDCLNGYYQNIVKNRNLGNYVKFLGQRNDVPRLLKISNVGASSSIREGLGLNLVESLLVGNPVVALDNRGHREIVEERVNGYLVNDDKTFANRIISLKESPLDKDDIIKSAEKFKIKNSLKIAERIYYEK